MIPGRSRLAAQVTEAYAPPLVLTTAARYALRHHLFWSCGSDLDRVASLGVQTPIPKQIVSETIMGTPTFNNVLSRIDWSRLKGCNCSGDAVRQRLLAWFHSSEQLSTNKLDSLYDHLENCSASQGLVSDSAVAVVTVLVSSYSRHLPIHIRAGVVDYLIKVVNGSPHPSARPDVVVTCKGIIREGVWHLAHEGGVYAVELFDEVFDHLPLSSSKVVLREICQSTAKNALHSRGSE